MPLNVVETFRANLSFVFMERLGSFLWDTSDVWMMRISTCRAIFLWLTSALSPVMAREKTAITYSLSSDDFPLIFGVGVLEHDTIWRGVIVG